MATLAAAPQRNTMALKSGVTRQAPRGSTDASGAVGEFPANIFLVRSRFPTGVSENKYGVTGTLSDK